MRNDSKEIMMMFVPANKSAKKKKKTGGYSGNGTLNREHRDLA